MLSSHNQLVLQHAQYLAAQGYIPLLIHGVSFVLREDGRHHPVCTCYAKEGCSTPGKHPVRGWVQSPMRTPLESMKILNDLLSNARAGHDYNLAVRTGPEGGCMAIDIDAKGNGFANFEAFLKAKQINSEVHYGTLFASTGGGGRHYVYNYPRTVEKIPTVSNHAAFNFKLNPKNADNSSVDVKGDGGYIVVQPSRHKSGSHYVWNSDPSTGRKDAPAEIIQAVEGKRRTADTLGYYTPDIEELRATAAQFVKSKKEGTASIGRVFSDILDGKALDPDSGAHDVYKRVAYHVAMVHPRSDPIDLAEFFRPSVDARMALKPDASCTFEDVFKCVDSALKKRREEEAHWENQLIKNENGKIISCTKNVLSTLSCSPEWEGIFALDARAQRPLVLRAPPGLALTDVQDNIYPRPLLDADEVNIVKRLTERYQTGIRREHVSEALTLLVRERAVDIFLEYFKALPPWDGVPRLETWLIALGGAEDSPYVRTVSRMFLLQMANRTLDPGCQADAVLILEGAQGIGKSRLLRALVPYPRLFCDDLSIISGHQNKDNVMKLHGPALVELAELSAMHKSDVEPVKAFITTSIDSYRPPYARNVLEIPRRCVFAGTTNSDQYLRDSTGNRRFWPVALTRQIDVAGVITNRDQIWAESLYRISALKERYHLEGAIENTAAEEVQSERSAPEPWYEPVAEFIEARDKAVARAKFTDLTATSSPTASGRPPRVADSEHEAEDPDDVAKMFWLDKYDPNATKVIWDEPLKARYGELEHFSIEHVLKRIFGDELGPQHRTPSILTSIRNSLKLLGYEDYRHSLRDSYRYKRLWRAKNH